jgi:hypothetical protein
MLGGMTLPLTAADLRRIASAAEGRRCEACEVLVCPGWESLPAGFDGRQLHLLATLRPGDDEPTWAEHHPLGTRTDSPAAPIAPAFHPYNRSDVVACAGCGRAFLRYTEAGGYFSDVRLRDLDPALVAG